MKRVIIFVAPDTGTADMNIRVDTLSITADNLGFMVTRNDVVPDDAPIAQLHLRGSTRLLELASNDHERDRALSSGIVTLLELTSLTAYEAWQKLGGVMVSRYRLGAQRGPGNLFHAICTAMATEGLQFADLDPASFKQYTRDSWKQFSDDGRVVGILHNVELLDVRILAQAQEEDIMGFSGCREAYMRKIMAIRDELIAKQQ